MGKLVLTRRNLLKASLATGLSLPLGGCGLFDGLRDRQNAMRMFMQNTANGLTYRTQRLLLSADQRATEFTKADIRQGQKPNGSIDPDTPAYLTLKEKGFAGYQLMVDGLVEAPRSFSLDDLVKLPQRTQITRHDCVEGWSTIAEWQGTPLRHVLEKVRLKPDAKYVVFHCFDALTKSLSGLEYYYESIDLVDAFHPQTILAHTLNGKPLPVENGAPLRVRVERQLGYKMAKYIQRIEVVSDLSAIHGGNGSYWADRGYEWFAGV
jgi:DMSO/TMAO reductase YedYZ molybdopterin-dependent catalytic subunit